jgi:phospholipase/carboxylesterase
MNPNDPHKDQPILFEGASLDRARAVMIMVHGRGANARSILTLVPELAQTDIAFVAPQAANNTWYPYSFLHPITSNEPYLTSALNALTALVHRLNDAGFPNEKIMLLGFSQGACLSSEFVARNAARYGGLFVLSGGLIGPDGTPRNYPGSLDGTPVFLGCSDMDPHIPLARVHESTEVLRKLGGNVTERIYPGMGHIVNEDEISFVRGVINNILA